MLWAFGRARAIFAGGQIMTNNLIPDEKRQFGRRNVVWHAWVKVAGRDRHPCIVRNFSVAGALLEFDGPVPAADRCVLIIDRFNFEANCFVRHRSKTAVGVYFTDTMDGVVVPGKVTAEAIVARINEARQTPAPEPAVVRPGGQTPRIP
jgi:hypothetical protein